MDCLGVILWDPDAIAFRLPIIGHPIAWYGILFALAFFLGSWLTRRVVARHLHDRDPALEDQPCKRLAAKFTDRFLWFTVVGTVVGARLGHILFYDLDRYLDKPSEILMVWHGGLASHGAVVGVLLALFLFRWRTRDPDFSLLKLLDIAVIPAAMIGVFIRFGNFVNQELVGKPSSLPWAVLFGHPADGRVAVPRHPVQLYEALAYLGVFLLLFGLCQRFALRRRAGLLAGLFFALVFGARFLLEFFKEHQSQWLSDSSWLSMAQWLSLPLVALGLLLSVRFVARQS